MNTNGPGNRPNTMVPGGSLFEGHSTEMRRLPARIFVVDDEDFIRDLYRDVFESRGMTVFTAPSGDEAVKIFRTMIHRPDIVIMDHRMPGKDGIETTKELLRMDPSVPIIFSSADETVREKALEAGAVSFWAKPFPVSLLVDAMLDIVKAKRREG
ncbi:MAG: response regulator [Thermoplasmata archaeon]